MIEFKGGCKGVRLEPRGADDDHIMVTILAEDDGNWFDKDTFSSFWLDELIEELTEARDYIYHRTYRDPSGGYRFKKPQKDVKV